MTVLAVVYFQETVREYTQWNEQNLKKTFIRRRRRNGYD